MKTLLTKLSLMAVTVLLCSFCRAEEDWPREITAADGTVIKMYQPEAESFVSNVLKFRSAISILETGKTDPVFGTFWSTSKVQTDRDNRQVGFETVTITEIKIPSITDVDRLNYIKTTLETQIPNSVNQMPLDEILTSLDQNQEQAKMSNNISNKPPKIMFTTQPSILAFIDGEPKLQKNSDWDVDVVVNSPFTIIKNTDNQFYLFGGHHWYTAPKATGPYTYANHVSDNLVKIETSLNTSNSNNKSNSSNPPANSDNVISNIIISTTPAELIQSKGEANFSPIDGTNLLFVKNSDNDIFMDETSQLYYVLISGRWYTTKDLKSNHWNYIAADKLPADFAKIPEGSQKDNVLASVAGTEAAKEAVMDAQIPQTARVDRKTATTTVTYNGQPQFQDIEGTNLQYAINTSATVLHYNNLFYAVDNGVWFVSDRPTGPWTVSTDRPGDVDMIPPSSPVYNTKYVYVYDVTPDYVYMGYTPGYLNSYVYGPTIVYGTGYYYNPWYGSYYYPRPWSWGFNIGYNPWYGWSFGFGYSTGWFYPYSGYGYGYGYGGGYYHCGWWGPAIYHPAYCNWGGGYGHYYGGYYGRNSTINRTNNYVRVNNTNNIYRSRSGVTTRTNSNFGGYNANRPQVTGSTRQSNNGGTMNNGRPQGNYNGSPNSGTRNSTGVNNGRPSNNLYSDRQGNVFQRSNQGWQERSNRSWAPVNNTQRPDVVRNLDRQQQMRDRGQVRAQNFESARSSAGGGQAPRSFSSGGGGSRSSGGGGGGSRPSSGGGGGGSRSSSGGGGSRR